LHFKYSTGAWRCPEDDRGTGKMEDGRGKMERGKWKGEVIARFSIWS
jgi:hypothetical protein